VAGSKYFQERAHFTPAAGRHHRHAADVVGGRRPPALAGTTPDRRGDATSARSMPSQRAMQIAIGNVDDGAASSDEPMRLARARAPARR
jgi:hypothetical protein